MTKKKVYTIDGWRSEGESSSWCRIQLGKLHYRASTKIKPAGFGYRVAPWDTKFQQGYATNGWDFVERIELDIDAYNGVLQAYIDTEIDDKNADVYCNAVFYINEIKNWFELTTPNLLEKNASLQHKKIARILKNGTDNEQWILLCDELTRNNKLFEHALTAWPFLNYSEKDQFFVNFFAYISAGYLHRKNITTLRDCLARICVAHYPEKATLDIARFYIDGIEFASEDAGVQALMTLRHAFENKTIKNDTIELPAGFEP